MPHFFKTVPPTTRHSSTDPRQQPFCCSPPCSYASHKCPVLLPFVTTTTSLLHLMTRRSGDASTRSPAVSLSRAKKTQQRQKQLKIIPYCPDAPQRKTSRRNECENSTQTASEAPEDTTVAKAIPPRLERIPSSRSWDPFNALAVLYVSKAERFILNYGTTPLLTSQNRMSVRPSQCHAILFLSIFIMFDMGSMC